MKQSLEKWLVFIAKSMLWSLSFYFALMLAFNWDDVSSKISGKSAVTTVANPIASPQAGDADSHGNTPAKISSTGSLLISDVYSLVRIIGRI